MSFSPFLSVEQTCDKVLQWISEQFARAGLHTVQTFDLHTVRAGIGDCLCQDHGTSQCDCQMVILFVYEQAGEPVTLVLHGNHGQTWLSFAETPKAGFNTALAKSIQQQLEILSPNFQSS